MADFRRTLLDALVDLLPSAEICPCDTTGRVIARAAAIWRNGRMPSARVAISPTPAGAGA